MKIIKKINNNAAVGLDDNNHELVALGTGVGFPECPYELEDLSIIKRTYYDVDERYFELINTISIDILNVATEIVDNYQLKIVDEVSSNLIFTLADHLAFVIERIKKNIYLDAPFQYDVQHLYEVEYEAGLDALKIIKKELSIKLPKTEASTIALHFINARYSSNTQQGYVDRIIEDVVEIISKHFKMYIDKDSFNYSRFMTHLQYLLKRQEKNIVIFTDNKKMFDAIVMEYSETYNCVKKIEKYLEEEEIYLNEEELFYLILHVNRLCVREDCYRKSITPPQ